MRGAIIGLAVLTVGGCATPAPSPYIWSKAGATNDDYLRDRYECITQARSTVSGGVAYGAMARTQSGEIVRNDIFAACMAARGYREDPNGPFRPPGT